MFVIFMTTNIFDEFYMIQNSIINFDTFVISMTINIFDEYYMIQNLNFFEILALSSNDFFLSKNSIMHLRQKIYLHIESQKKSSKSKKTKKYFVFIWQQINDVVNQFESDFDDFRRRFKHVTDIRWNFIVEIDFAKILFSRKIQSREFSQFRSCFHTSIFVDWLIAIFFDHQFKI